MRSHSMPSSISTISVCSDACGALVVSSVTDYNTPALGSYIGRELCVREDCVFINVEGQGCQSLAPALQRAYEFWQVHHEPVLCVNTELCSTTYFPSDEADREMVVTNALFGDGAAAVLVGDDPDPLHPVIVDFQSLYDPRYLDLLGYTWVDGRLRCRLDPRVPEVMPPLIAKAVDLLLKRNHLRQEDVRYWAIHPGGPAILRHTEKLLNLTPDDTWASWETLREFGNCSSVTLALIAKRISDQCKDPHGYGVGVTMGAGGACEAMLVRYDEGN